METMKFDLATYVLIPLLIFTLRIFDVSLGTIRIIFISKGYKSIAPFVGFIEILIWIIAISRIMENLNNWICYVSYAGGFAAGNYAGMLLEERLAIGHELIRIITRKDAKDLIDSLSNKGYGVTSINARGVTGEVGVVYIIVNRKMLNETIEIIKHYNPQALYTIEDIRYVNKEIYHMYKPNIRKSRLRLIKKR
jgi:uncharacterized protein YebE (UPF0316 family)